MSQQAAQAAQVPTVKQATRGAPAFEVPKSSWAKARERLAWLLVFPSILVVTLVALFPLAQSFWFSFTNARLAGTPRGGLQFVGLDNYTYLLRNDDFIRSFWNTVLFTVSSVTIETVLGVIVALIINSQFRGRGLLRTAILVPWAIPTVVSSRLWSYMFNGQYGVINDILTVRLPNAVDWIPVIGPSLASIFPENRIAFLATPSLQMPTAIAVDVWKTVPFMALLLLAGLQVIPGDVYEASYVDGASKWQQFWQHTLPLLRPALLVALIFRTLDAFRVFDVLFVMFGPITQTRSLAIAAQQALVDGDRLGRASAASVLIFLCIGVMVLIYTRLVKVEEGRMATIAATAPRAQSVASRRRVSVGQLLTRGAFWLLVAFFFFYTLFPFYWALVTSLKPGPTLGEFPVSYWPSSIDWSHLEYVFENRGFLLALRNSTIISVVTVLIALTLGAFAAYAMGRMQFRGKNFSLYLILSMTMFPQIAILGALFQTIRRLDLYNTMPALIITYLTFTLPFTVWVLANFFRAMPGDLEEAALVDGATPFQAFSKILLPLALPGLVTTGLLAFIAAWNEYLFALTFTSTGDFRARTVQPTIGSFSGPSQFEEPWGAVMAASVVVTVPLVVLVLIFQRKILAGLTAGAVKG